MLYELKITYVELDLRIQKAIGDINVSELDSVKQIAYCINRNCSNVISHCMPVHNHR